MVRSDKNFETGIILVVLERFEKQRLPWFNDVKTKLDSGGHLNEFDIEMMSEALHDIRSLFPYLDKHTEFEPVMSQVIHYYKTIIDLAVTNER